MNDQLTPALLFDLGGVVMNIDRMQAVRAFEELGMADANAFFDPYEQHGIFGLLEAGQISPADFRARLRPQFRPGVSDAEMDRALCRFLLGIPPERLERLAELRAAGHNVFMLSNTNPIMWQAFILPEFGKLGGNINDYFDGTVTSFEAGVCKPHEQIYRYAIKKLGLTPSETTFYDDGQANVDAAIALGFHGELVSAQNDMLKLTANG